MNSKTNTTAPAETASALTMDEAYKLFDDIWNDIMVLQRKAYLLMGDLDKGLDQQRGKIDDTTVTLMFQKRSIDVTQWLAGDVWSDTLTLEQKADVLIARLEGSLQ